MTLLRIGQEFINLGMVAKFRMVPQPEEEGLGLRVEAVLLNGAVVAIEGEDALKLRRYLVANSTSLDTEPPSAEFSTTGESLLPHPASGKQGT